MRSVSNSVVLERVTKELNSLSTLTSNLSNVASLLSSGCDDKTYSDCINYLMTVASKSSEIIAKWTQYSNNYKNYSLEEDERRVAAEAKAEQQEAQLKAQAEKIEQLTKQIAEFEHLQSQSEDLKKLRKHAVTINSNFEKLFTKIQDLMLKNQEALTKEIQSLKIQSNTEEIESLQTEIQKALQIAETGQKFKQNQGRLKNKGKGENSIRFNHNIDSEKLIEEYKQAGNRITSEMTRRYSAKGITYQGLRKRLITEGVWNPTPRARKDDD